MIFGKVAHDLVKRMQKIDDDNATVDCWKFEVNSYFYQTFFIQLTIDSVIDISTLGSLACKGINKIYT